MKPCKDFMYQFIGRNGKISIRAASIDDEELYNNLATNYPYRAIQAFDPAQNMKPVPFDPFYIDNDGKVVMD